MSEAPKSTYDICTGLVARWKELKKTTYHLTDNFDGQLYDLLDELEKTMVIFEDQMKESSDDGVEQDPQELV